MQSTIVGLLVVTAFLVVSLDAFPDRPGACVGGRSAALGHATPSPIPTFADQGYSLLIDGEVVNDPSTITFQVGTSYEIAVQATGTPFRGALIRVDGMGILTANRNSGIATACTDVQGVGHTNSGNKSFLSGLFLVEGGSSVTVDVTVVERNERDDSIYSYEGFQFAVAGAAAPVMAPTEMPVVAPTDMPVVAPTTDAPVVTPTDMPVVAPVTEPTEMPVVTPTEAPVMAPIAENTDMPVVATTEAPIMAPVAAEMPVEAAPSIERCVRRRK